MAAPLLVSSRTYRIRGSSLARAPTTSVVSSVEQSSTTISSQRGWVWAWTVAMVSAMKAPQLYVGMMMETRSESSS